MNNKNIVYSSTYTEKTSSHRVNMDSFSETTIPSIMIDSHILPGESTFPPMEESHMPEKKKIPPNIHTVTYPSIIIILNIKT